MQRSLPSLLSSPLSFLRPLPCSFVPPPPSSHRPIHFYSPRFPPATVTRGEKTGENAETAERENEVFFSEKYLKYKYALNSQVMGRLPRFHREADAKRASMALHGNEETLERVREQKAKLDMHRLKHLQEMLNQKKQPLPPPSPPPKSTLSPSLSYDLQKNHHQPPPKAKQAHQTPSIRELWEADGSSRTVLIAIFGNFCVMGSKFGGFLLTGSASLLSEAIHSFADLGNQVLLAIGVQKSKKKADSRHPYGYSHERYIWALISGVGIFFLGCGVSMYHGVTQLLDPTPITSPSIAFGTLAFAFVVEGITFLLAYRQVSRSARQLGVSFREYVQRGPDPMGVAVLAEDGAAVLGVGIAGLCIGASLLTGDMRWDGVGSLAIGSIMAIVAVFLVHKNREILLGQSIPQVQMNKILRHLENEKIIKEVKDVKALMIGSDSMRFKAEIHFHGSVLAETYLKQHVDSEALLSSLETTEQLDEFLIEYGAGLVEFIGDEVDRLEESIRQHNPNVHHIDLEVD